MGFTPDRNADPTSELLHPLSAEQRFWMRHLSWLLAPRDGNGIWLARAIGVITVVPITNFTPLSLVYQAYLNHIFHRTAVARIAHSVFIPLTTWWLMVAAVPLAGAPFESHALDLANLTSVNGGTIVGTVLAAWYLLWAGIERSALWGLVMLGAVAMMCVGANAYFAVTHRSAPGLAWYEATSLAHSPLLWMLVTAFGQAVSHGAEPELPPRVNGTTRWVALADFIKGIGAHGSSPLPAWERGTRLIAQVFFGTFDEWIAAPRLFPVYVLELMWAFGYQPERRREIRRLSQRCVASGNPALDYIGIGGGTLMRAEPE